MGDIVRKVKISGLTPEGGLRRDRIVNALIDPGASKTVVTSALAHAIEAALMPAQTLIEGRRVPLNLAAIRLDAPRCGVDVIAVAVDDALMARAGRPSGQQIDVILGHDYLQSQRVALQYANGSGQQDAVCTVPAKKKRARR